MTLDDNFMPDAGGLLDLFVDWYNAKVVDYDIPRLTREEAYIVWFCYTVGNAKALISTTRKDHMYYEVTYNNLKGEAYVDQYIKITHTTLSKETKIKEKQSPIFDDPGLRRYCQNTDKHASFFSEGAHD